MANRKSSNQIDLQAEYDRATRFCETLSEHVETMERDLLATKEAARDLKQRLRAANHAQEKRLRLERQMAEHVGHLNRLRGEVATAAASRPVVVQELPRLKIQPHDVAAAVMAIVKGAGDVPRESNCGVYFLIRDDRIVYVGQSIDVVERVARHRKDATTTFNRAAWIPCEPSRLCDVEMFWIRAILPEHNRTGIRQPSAVDFELSMALDSAAMLAIDS